MLLHGAFEHGRFLLWGETPADKAVKLRKRPGRRPKVALPPWYPFDPGAEALAAALAEAGLLLEDLTVDRVALWLPSQGNRPLASNGLIEEPPDALDGVAIAPWTAFALSFEPAAALELLCRCVGAGTLAPGVVVANDLAFWTTALRFAGSLVAKQSVLPDVVEQAGECFARWRPVLAGADAAAQHALAARMPHACRAVSREATPPSRASVALLAEFVELTVDALVRTAHQGRPPPVPASIDDRWLAALSGPDARIQGSPEELRQLAQRCRDWRRPVSLALASPFRLCFRLEEPALGAEDDGSVVSGAGAGWTVRYLLQAYHDPSLLVPAADAWRARGRAATPFRLPGFNVRDFLLHTLGQAARICPDVERSLRGSVPTGFDTDAAGAVAFLTETAAALEQAGFGVMLPAWWTSKGTKLRLSARAQVKTPKLVAGGGLSLDEIVQFQWQAALGEDRLSERELRALARLKVPLVRVRGQWVLLDAAEIREAIALLQSKEEKVSAREVLRMALGGAERAAALPLAGVEAQGWIADLLARLRQPDAVEALPPPGGFSGSLRPYQVRGYAWLGFLARWGLGACLADDMGLGKTIQTLAHIQRDKEAAGARPCVLLVCPTSVVGNWQREAARFTPALAIVAHHGAGRSKGAALREEAARHDLVITSYGLLQRDIAALQEVPWTGVILDEAQNIKNPETKQARAARALRTGYRIALTGTPVENTVGDLWSLMEFLNPGLLGTQAGFRRRFFIPIQANRDPDAIARLKSLTGPFILRRLKTDTSIIADLPEKMEMKVFCNLTREQASLYAAVVEDTLQALESADGIQRKGVVLATLSKLKQVCNHPAQFLGDNSAIPGRSGKLARLAEMLEEVLAVGERALVFTQFAEMGAIIKDHLQDTFGREVLFLHGAVPKARRDKMVVRFQGAGPEAPPLFLLSLKAGGTGLNLTAANHVFHFDRWWNPAVEDQATDRAFRIGQTRRVQVHKFLCVGTLEEKIDAMIEAKKTVAQAVVGTGEGWLTELSTEELRSLFALRAEAVAD